MKRRIEKLFNEAGFHKPEVERLGIEHKFEKFAELIVRECVSICYAESRTAGANGKLAEYSALSKAGGHIKDHFGVKE